MALALIVEDGTNVAGANSYATLEQIKAFNAQRGIDLPVSDDGIIAQAAVAMDYLSTYEFRLAGARTYGAMQGLAWPRAKVKAYGSLIASNVVPIDIVNVQCYLVGIAGAIDLTGNSDGGIITKDAIGPFDIEYSPTQGSSYGPILPIVFSMLRPYLGDAAMIRSKRV